MVMHTAQTLVNFINTPSITLVGATPRSLEPVNPPEGATIVRSNITGTGRIDIDAGAQLTLAGSAQVDLSGGPGGVCTVPDPGAPNNINIDGSLVVRDQVVRAYGPRDLAGQRWRAIAWTTAASAVAVVDLVASGRLPQRGFVRQEDVKAADFYATPTGRLFDVQTERVAA